MGVVWTLFTLAVLVSMIIIALYFACLMFLGMREVPNCEVACKASSRDKWKVLSHDECECWNEDCSNYNFKGVNYTFCTEFDKITVRVEK